MRSGDKQGPVVLQFPAPATQNGPSSEASAQTLDLEDFAEIRQRCRDTAKALQELHHGIANALMDVLEKLSLDPLTLVQVLDERPSVVRDLLADEIDDLTTERMISHVEKLVRVVKA